MVLQFLGLAISSCSTEFGPVDRSSGANTGTADSASSGFQDGNGITDASPFNSGGSVGGDGVGDTLEAASDGYFPELGEFNPALASVEFFGPCFDVPRDFYESFGLTDLKFQYHADSEIGTCSHAWLGDLSEVSFGSTPHSLSGRRISEVPGRWSKTSFRDPFLLVCERSGLLSNCMATIETTRATLAVGFASVGFSEPEDLCIDAEYWLRTLLTADGRDNYHG
ncbi:MAG: hypothetical protein WAW05_10180 [Corynebacterium casei]